MKILVVCQYYYPEPFRVSDICEALVQKGHEVTVLTGLPNYPEGRVLQEYKNGNRRKEIINGVKVIRTCEIGRGKSSKNLMLNYISFMLSSSIKVLLMREKFEVVFVNQLSPILMAVPAIIYKKIYKKKMFLYCLDLWPESLVAGGINQTSIIYRVLKKISNWIYKSADQLMVSSYSFIEYFKNTLEYKNKDIVHLPQYAEDIFLGVGIEKKKKSGSFDFVFAGNIGEMQSVDTIIKAADILKVHQNIKFHIVGDGSKLEQCIQLCKRLKLNNVRFYGRKPLSDMPQFYSMADAMLVTLKNDPIISYTLPGKVQTYMAAKKPIIGAINGEAQIVVEQSNCGMCCEAEDYKSLANLIIDFCYREDKETLASNGEIYYKENYSKEKFISNLEKIIKE